MEASAVPRSAPTGVTGVSSPQLLRLASDARLVTLVRQGWPAAFEAVYNRHHRGILSFCRHVLSDADEAEDAVQHTFLAAYNDLIASDKPIHLRAWLFTIARNRCYSILRARREQPAADLDEPVTEGLATQVQRRQDLRDLVIDLRSLPDEQRAALVLAELDALSHEEIGEALGVPREKVKALVFQARESLVASRTARETACADIREQLSNGRGGALRRANLRRHLRDCSGCRDYRRQVERQRRQIAALLPVAPTLALKETVLAGTGGSAGFSGGGLLASGALKSGLVKAFATLMLATAGTAGTYVATHDFHVRSIFGSHAKGGPQAQSAPGSAAGLVPIVRRAVDVAPSIDRVASVAASELRHYGGVRLTRLTTPVNPRSGVLNPFGPLVHSRVNFPRSSRWRVQTIAPPKSTGKPPASTPVTVPGAPSATITSTSTPPSVGETKPVTDRPTTGGDSHGVGSGTAGHPRSVGSSNGGTTRTRVGGGRGHKGGETVPARGSSGHTAGKPTDRGSGDGKSTVGGEPRGVTGHDGATPGPGDSGTTPGPGDSGTTPGPGDSGTTPAPGDPGTTPAPGDSGTTPSNGQPPATATTELDPTGTGGSGGDPSGGTGSPAGTAAIPS
jgi:RNA polymerase sigma factor (sigma-70 family)